MTRVRKGTAAVVMWSMFVSATGAAAQTTTPVTPTAVAAETPAKDETMAAGLLEGEVLADAHRTGGKFGAGLGVGVLTGLIGTGIGYFVVGPAPLSAEALQRSAGRSADFQLGLKTGWERKTQSKKRNAFLAGGLLGTAAFFVVVAGAGGD